MIFRFQLVSAEGLKPILYLKIRCLYCVILLVYSNGHISILFYVHAQICECLSVLCSYMEYIFEFVDDVGKVWFPCPDDVIYNSNNFSLITKSK